MPETTATTPMSRPSERAIWARVGLARAALLWERCWPEFALAFAVAGLFLAAALFELPSAVPGWAHAAGLIVLAALFSVAVYRGIRALRIPGESEGRRRIEAASGLEHRPLAALSDRLVAGAGDPVAVALWHAHRARMARHVRGLRVGLPLAGFLGRDPFGLRVVLAIALLIGFMDAGADSGDRVLRALVPQLSLPAGAATAISLDIWVTPPDYTGEAPLFLQRGTAQQPISVPTGSTVLAQVQGGSGAPRLEIGSATQIVHNGNEEQKQKWLPRIGKGELVGCITTRCFAIGCRLQHL